ncbi:MAG: exoribonuclease R, partial [Planctomycetes bacterium]|nr:exoribonuclease R [Planctomycetota bacterium]
MLIPTRFSEARSRFSRLFDEAVEELRPALVRRGARQEAVLISREDLEVLLLPFTLRPQVMREDDGSVTITVDELDWATNAASVEEATGVLVADLRQYAEDYLERASLFLRAPNRRPHFPYVLRIVLARNEEEIRRG